MNILQLFRCPGTGSPPNSLLPRTLRHGRSNGLLRAASCRGLSLSRALWISPPPAFIAAKASRAANLLARRYEADIWTAPIRSALAFFENTRFDLIVCHDALLLPLAFAVRDAFPGVRCPVVMDAREYYPRQFEHSFIWRLMLGGLNGYLCRRYLPRADLFSQYLPDCGRLSGRVRCCPGELPPSYPDFRISHRTRPTCPASVASTMERPRPGESWN